MLNRAIALSVAAAWLAGCAAPEPAPVAGAVESRRDTCSRERLDGILALDTTDLVGADYYEGPQDRSTEGMTLRAYSRDATVVLVEGTYFGELGKTTDRYHLMSSRDYAVETTTVMYAQPIYLQPQPEIVEREQSVTYVCGDVPLGDSLTDRQRAHPENLREFIAIIERQVGAPVQFGIEPPSVDR